MSRLAGVKVEGVEARSRVGISGVSSGRTSTKMVGIGLISRLRLASILHGRYGDGWRHQLSIARYIRRRHNLLVVDLLWVSHSSRVSHKMPSSPKMILPGSDPKLCPTQGEDSHPLAPREALLGPSARPGAAVGLRAGNES